LEHPFSLQLLTCRDPSEVELGLDTRIFPLHSVAVEAVLLLTEEVSHFSRFAVR